MALNSTTLGTAIAAAMDAKMTALYPASAPGLLEYHTELAEAIADAVIAHLTANAVINPGTMAAGGDAVTGTGTVT